MGEIKSVLESPPAKWQQYEKAHDHWGIIEMELVEVKSALRNYHLDPNKIHDAIKELGHVAAATLHMMQGLKLKACEMQTSKQASK